MKSKTCCFTGHRRIPKGELPQIKTKLKNTITELIGNGIIYYGAGGALGFDTHAALTVLELKQQHPQIKLILVFPCKNQTRNWRQKILKYMKTSSPKRTKLSILPSIIIPAVCKKGNQSQSHSRNHGACRYYNHYGHL